MRNFILLPLLFLVACATSPIDTHNKRMAALEITTQEVVSMAIQARSEGRLTADQEKAITEVFDKIKALRAAAYAALEVGEIDLASGHMALMSQALTGLRQMLVEMENE